MESSAARSRDDRVTEIIARDTRISLRRDLSGRDLSTFSIGGPLRVVAEVDTIEDLQTLMQVLAEHQLEFSIIGAGSNVLFADEGIDRWIIRLGGSFRGWREEPYSEGAVRVIVGGAFPVIALSRELSSKGYDGIAFAGGIPASLGGAVRMNAGAHGGEFSQIVEWVEIVEGGGALRRMSCAEMQFSYRHSAISESDIVVAASLIMARAPIEETMARRAHCLEERRSRQPLSLPSAGSVFKNPSVEKSAGMLLEQAGMKGFQHGGVMVSEKHANWIVNPGKKGSARDVRELISICQERVERQFQIALRPEIITLF